MIEGKDGIYHDLGLLLDILPPRKPDHVHDKVSWKSRYT